MEEKTDIKLILADDHELLRNGIIELLRSNDEIKIIDVAENGEELVNKYFLLRPDLLLVDISMPVLSGFDALKKIKREDPSVKSLFLSMYDTEEYIYGSLKLGAMGLINKNVNQSELVYAIKQVYHGRTYWGKLNESQVQDVIIKFEKKMKNNIDLDVEISPREKTIIKYIGDGLTSSEIAEKLNISKRTIDAHRYHLISKLNLNSLSGLIKFSIEYSNKK